jgi:hypothetical protein
LRQEVEKVPLLEDEQGPNAPSRTASNDDWAGIANFVVAVEKLRPYYCNGHELVHPELDQSMLAFEYASLYCDL